MSNDQGSAKTLGSSVKDLVSIPNAIGILINFVIVLKISNFLLNRNFSGIAGKVAAFYAKTETDLIDGLAAIVRWAWLKTFLAYNLDPLIICILLLLMSLRSSTRFMKKYGTLSANNTKISDTITAMFFVSFGTAAVMLLNVARGCIGAAGCNIVTYNTLNLTSASTYILPMSALVLLSNVIGLPVLFVVSKIKPVPRVIFICYCAILFQLLVFSLVTLFTLMVASV